MEHEEKKKTTSLRVIEWSATNICYLIRFYPFSVSIQWIQKAFLTILCRCLYQTGYWLHHEKFFQLSSHFTHPIFRFCFTFPLLLRNVAEQWILESTKKELTFRCHSTLLVVIESKIPMKSENQNFG